MSDQVPVRLGDGLYLLNRCARVTAYPLVASTTSSAQPTSGVTVDVAKLTKQFPGLKMLGSVIQDTPRTVGIIAATPDPGPDTGVADAAATPSPATEPVTTYRPTGSTVEITGLRIQFDIEKALTKHPNKCQITISNLSRETRAIFEKQPVTISLEAGHDQVFHSLFFGDQIFARSEVKGTDWETLAQVSDGSRAFNFTRVSKSYVRGTPVLTALRDVAAAMGQDLPRNLVVDDVLRSQFLTGAVVIGAARDELTRLLAPYGYRWSMQDGRIQCLREDEVADGQAILIQQSTGMIGSPAYGTPHRNGKPPALHIKMLLYPGLKCGQRIKVVSQTVNGLFRIEKVTHKGDTHGPEWESLIEAQPTTAGSADPTPAPPRATDYAKYIGGASMVGKVASQSK